MLVRALVARMELITPAVEAEVELALKDGAGADPVRREAGESRLARLGRFLEPHLRNVLAVTKDDIVRHAAKERLHHVRGAHDA